MKGKYGIILSVFMGLVVFMTACGEKSQEQITDKLTKQVTELDSYSAVAEMTMNTGQEEQKYVIDVLYKADHFYRIHLQNANDQGESQRIIKNDDGVFVLTPEQEKTFKFQSDWPENGSQAYLYQSLVNDVLKDAGASFHASEDYYVYHVAANYQNSHQLPRQEIFFNKKTLSPALVNVYDQDEDTIVSVQFKEFKFNPELSLSEFEVEENAAESIAELDERSEDVEFEVLYPLETLGAELTDQKEVYLDDGKRILMVFSGEKNFTLVQERRMAEASFSEVYDVKGELLHLGSLLAGISDSSVEWTANGVEYYLASEELSKEELIEIAMSVQGREIK